MTSDTRPDVLALAEALHREDITGRAIHEERWAMQVPAFRAIECSACQGHATALLAALPEGWHLVHAEAHADTARPVEPPDSDKRNINDWLDSFAEPLSPRQRESVFNGIAAEASRARAWENEATSRDAHIARLSEALESIVGIAAVKGPKFEGILALATDALASQPDIAARPDPVCDCGLLGVHAPECSISVYAPDIAAGAPTE